MTVHRGRRRVNPARSISRPARDSQSASLPSAWFAAALMGLAVLGLLLRLWYADESLFTGTGGDPMWYHLIANRLADGLGYTNPGVGGIAGSPTGFHPPLFSLVLSVGSLIGLRSFDDHQMIGCLLGALTIPVVGIIGRQVAGQTVGLIAAALATVSLAMIADSSTLYSEGLYSLLVACSLWAALRLLRDRSVINAAALAGLVMLATLTKADAILLFVLVGALTLSGGPGRWQRTAAAAVTALVILAPWSAYESAKFGKPVVLSTNLGSVLAGANCDQAYHGDLKGSWSLFCLMNADGAAPAGDESEQSKAWTKQAREYATDHVGALPGVVVARVLRTTGAWDPEATVRLDRFTFAVPRALGWPLLAWMWITILAGGAGAAVLYRRWPEATLVLLAPVLLAFLMAAVTYGATRFRAPAEPSLMIFCAVAVAWVGRRLADRSRFRSGPQLTAPV